MQTALNLGNLFGPNAAAAPNVPAPNAQNVNATRGPLAQGGIQAPNDYGYLNDAMFGPPAGPETRWRNTMPWA
jgi:hypothetical protein